MQKGLLLCLKSTASILSILTVSIFLFLEKQILKTDFLINIFIFTAQIAKALLSGYIH